MRSEIVTSVPCQASLEAGIPADEGSAALLSNSFRTLLYAAALQHPTTYQTPYSLGKQLNCLQGTEPGWHLQRASGLVNQTCDNMLKPTGLFEVGSINQVSTRAKDALGVRPARDGLLFHKAVAGSGLDWELQVLDRTLYGTLGKMIISAGLPFPSSRLIIYDTFLRSGRQHLSAAELGKAAGFSGHRTTQTMSRLILNGTVESISVHDFENRTLRISADSATVALRTANSGETIKRIAQITRHLADGRDKTVSVRDFLAAGRLLFPGVDPHELEQSIHARLVQQSPVAQLADRGLYDGNTLTAYSLVASQVPAIADLVLRARMLVSSPGFVDQSADRLDEIMNEPKDVAFLMTKSKPRERQWRLEDGVVTAADKLRRSLASLTLQQLPIDPNWRERAECFGQNTEQFFPVGTRGPSVEVAEKAKKICADCPIEVRTSCLQESFDTKDEFGIRGGMDQNERRAYRQNRLVENYRLLRGR